MKHRLLTELEEGLRYIKKNAAQRDVVLNYADAARVLGVSRQSVYRYRQRFPNFPALPTFATVLRIWAEQRGIPLKRGPKPSPRRKRVAEMREEQGKSFRQIARELGISVEAVRQLWKRHKSTQAPPPYYPVEVTGYKEGVRAAGCSRQ